MNLRDLVAPEHTAVLISEMQRGVVGDAAEQLLAPLGQNVRSAGVIQRLAELTSGARKSGVRVVHAVVRFRADGAGTPANTPMLTTLARANPGRMVDGTSGAEIVAALGPEPSDILSVRRHGMSAFGGTDLDVTLRGIGARTIVLGGVSLNIGILGTAIEAVNHGYSVVIVRDGVAGTPEAYGEDVLQHSLRSLGPQPTTQELLSAWRGGG